MSKNSQRYLIKNMQQKIRIPVSPQRLIFILFYLPQWNTAFLQIRKKSKSGQRNNFVLRVYKCASLLNKNRMLKLLILSLILLFALESAYTVSKPKVWEKALFWRRPAQLSCVLFHKNFALMRSYAASALFIVQITSI